MADELKVDDPCVIFALPRESMAFRKEFRPQQRFAGAPCWARFCGPSWLTVLVVHCGVGASAMQRAAEWLVKSPLLGNLPYQPKVILSAGYAGALRDGFAVGDVILATEIADASGNSWQVTWPEKLPEERWEPPLHRGRLLTVSKLVTTPDEKQQLGRQFDALAVDMESAVVARTCHRIGIPFGCVRVISDTVDTALSLQLASLLCGGRVSSLQMIATIFRHPAFVAELRRLAKATRQASEQLGKSLGELLTLTLPWSDELDQERRFRS